jgi:hypothetical protein
MTGDCHVRFCERLRGETPLCLLGARKNPRNSAGQTAAADPQFCGASTQPLFQGGVAPIAPINNLVG